VNSTGSGQAGKLSSRSLTMGLTICAAATALAGFYPTWRWGGRPALTAAAVAAGVDFLLVLLSGLLVRRMARRHGAVRTAQVFLAAGIVRMTLLVALGAAAIALFNLPSLVYWAWAVTAYLPMLILEVFWAGRGLGTLTASQPVPEVNA
jgi:hypothetical protein